MKTTKDTLESLENDATEKLLAYVRLRTEEPTNPLVPIFREIWQEASKRYRSELAASRDTGKAA
jgi:hypothetical protein